jgi:hypothetical protein
MITDSARFLRVPLMVASAMALAAPYFAQAEPVDRPAAVLDENTARSAALRQSFSDEFDQLALGAKGLEARAAARRRLDGLLAARIGAMDNVCGLSPAQRQKIELAGRGDLKQLFDRLESVRKEYQVAREDGTFDAVRNLLDADIAALRTALRSGPFDDDSLFARVSRKTLSAEQAEKYERRRQLAAQSTKKITVENAGALEQIGKLRHDVFRMVWNRDGRQLALLPFGKPVEIHSWPELQSLRTIGAEKQLVCFDFSRDDDVVAFAENSTFATMLNRATGKELRLDTGNPQPGVKFSPDGKLLATGGYGTSAKIWSVETGELVREFDAGLVGGQKGGLTPVFSPDGKLLAVGNRNSITCLFDVATGLVRHRLPKTMSQGLKFDPTGKRLAVTYVDGSLGVWEVETGRSLNQAKANAEELYSVDWSPDGSLLVTSGNKASVALWNAGDLTMLNELESPEWVITVAFSPDGTRLIFAGGTTITTTERYVETWAVP